MNLKNLNKYLFFVSVIAFLTSCRTIQSVSSKAKASIQQFKGSKNVVQTWGSNTIEEGEQIEFLDNLSVTPGKVFIKKS